MSSEPTITLAELNRATLARQLLLARRKAPVVKAIESLAGLQAEDSVSPYVALAVRLEVFGVADLTRALESRRVVRAPAMRSTLHILSANDYLLLAGALRPAHLAAFRRYYPKDWNRGDVGGIADAARELTDSSPRSFAELCELLAPLAPDAPNPHFFQWVARVHVPLVGLPPAGTWRNRASPRYLSAERALEHTVAPASDGSAHLVMRYLAAFGPASRQDVETWAGMTGLGKVLGGLAPKLRTFRDEQGRLLYDLPKGPRPGAGVPAPPRLLARADNVLLSHADRTRVLPKEYAAPVIRMGRMKAAFLVDGTVRGTWRIERSRKAAVLVLEPFEPIPKTRHAPLMAEATRMLKFVEPDATSHDRRLETPA